MPDIPEFTEDLFEAIPSKPEPVLIHEDNRLDNLLVQDSDITAFLDWSSAVSGPRMYDLARAEYFLIDGDATFPDMKILESKQKQYLRKKLLEGYNEERELTDNWLESDQRAVYRYAAILDIASGFKEWGQHFNKKLYQKTREELSKRLKAEQPKEFLQ